MNEPAKMRFPWKALAFYWGITLALALVVLVAQGPAFALAVLLGSLAGFALALPMILSAIHWRRKHPA